MFKKILTPRFTESTNLTVALLLVLIGMIAIILLADRYYLRWDLTASGRNTLSEKTLQVLQNITATVTVKAFVRAGDPEADEVRELLSSYQYQCPRIRFELIDPDRHPRQALFYHVKELNTLVLEGFERMQTVKPADEENITNALIRLLEKEVRPIYWITGHGERYFSGAENQSLSFLGGRLGNQNFALRELNLIQQEVPADAMVAILAAPVKPLLPAEIKRLRQYLERGGNLIVFLEPFQDAGLKEFLEQYGIRIAPDIIVDKLSETLEYSYLWSIITQYGAHPITNGFHINSLFAEARSIEKTAESGNDMTLTALALTSAGAWAETDQQSLAQGKAEPNKGERIGPLCLAVIVEIQRPLAGNLINPSAPVQSGAGTKAKLVVFGDVDFISNRFLDISGNSDLFMNTLNYLAERRNLITIEKKTDVAKPALLNGHQLLILFIVPVILLPLAVLTFWIAIWRKRRPR